MLYLCHHHYQNSLQCRQITHRIQLTTFAPTVKSAEAPSDRSESRPDRLRASEESDGLLVSASGHTIPPSAILRLKR